MDRTFDVDRLHVRCLATSGAMGSAAASDVAGRLRRLLDAQREVRAVFAAAASQETFLDALATEPGIDWARVEVLQLDEYVGLGLADPRSLSRWLAKRVIGRFGVGRPSYMRGDALDPAAEADRFEAEVLARPIDLGLIGIGINGHLAYNDPHVANFSDPRAVRVVEIDPTSRAQAVRDEAFPDEASVPRLAFTITMSALLVIRTLSIVVPGGHKAAAVARTLLDPVSAATPASALRGHPDATLYVDHDAFELAAVRLPVVAVEPR